MRETHGPVPEDEDRTTIADEVIAAEFVLGLLSPAEAALFARRLKQHPVLATLHAEWVADLVPLTAGRDVVPPDHVLSAAEARIFPRDRAFSQRAGWLRWTALIVLPLAAFAISLVLLQR
ncbi:hypothetical protein [Jannaschia pohangensis]|uniref:Anti-sigma factor n=1 Tax=Jannaschia pohangensis TaxID=390807 RepID=A0A1I3IPY3_9RHOB|nr:hypothetical protein [Jannaschia pohangensis]SFI49972.1 hypothetical protein SAMN04488095_1055 [Jannaschia pohangensis]